MYCIQPPRMKHLLWLLLVLPALAQQPEKTVNTTLTEVKVFADRAEETRIGTVTLSPGRYVLVFPGLSRYLDPATLQAEGKGRGVIQSLSTHYNHLNPQPKGSRFTRLEDSLKLLNHQLEARKNQRYVLGQEQSLITKNRSMEGSTGVDALQVQELLSWQRERLTQIRAELRTIAEDEEQLNTAKNRVTQQMADLTREHNQPGHEVHMEFSADASATYTFTLNYLVLNAGWAPRYDLRTTSDANRVQLEMKADVVNATGTDWKKVRLSLSTAQPNRSANAPTLATWYIQEYNPYAYNYDKNARLEATKGYAAERKVYDSLEQDTDEVSSGEDLRGGLDMSGFVSVQSGQLNREFVLEVKQDIPNDAKPHTVDLQRLELPCTMVHYAATRQQTTAYLQAAITGWEQYELLPGQANVYLDNTFMATTTIDPGATKDTLRMGLGQDGRVFISREQDREFTTRKTIGSMVKVQQKYSITVRNTKGKTVTLRLEDQVPVSNTSEIEVTLLDKGGATHNPNNGRLTWDLTLAPGEKKVITFSFEAKFKKELNIIGL